METVIDLPPTPSTATGSASEPAAADWRALFGDLAAGRMDALGRLYDIAARQLYGLALWRTGSEEDAADVVQDVFVRVVEQGRKLASVRNPRAWMLTVTHRASIDVTRRRRRRPTEPLEDYPFLTAAADDSDRMLDAAQASALLSEVSDMQRDVIFLKHFAGCTFSEIGEIVGVPKFTAASRYRAGIEKLRKLMEGDHDTR